MPDTARAGPTLGLWSATALVVGHTVAVGIFLTPAELIGALRSPALTLALWAGGGALVLAGALSFGELVSRFPRAGGPYVYLREAWGERLAFLYGWQCLLVMDPGITAALAAGAAQHVAVAHPAAAGAERAIAVATIWALALVNMAGLRAGARTLGTLTAMKILVLAGIAVLAFAGSAGSWSHFASTGDGGPPGRAEALALAVVSVFFSFGGFWEASRIAGEVRDPQRTLPRALALGVGVVTALYLATTAAFIYLVPPDRAATAPVFTQLAGTALFGADGPRVLALIIVLSVAASLGALLMMAPRLYVAMRRDGVLPSWLAPEGASGDTSARATAVLASIASVYALAGSFQQIVSFFICTALAFVGLAVAGLWALRRRDGRGASAFMVPAYPLVPVLFVAFVGVVVAAVAFARPLEALAGVAIVLLGVPAYRPSAASPLAPETSP